MSLVCMRELLAEAERKNCAIGAFNVSSIPMMMGYVRTAEELKTPIILQIAEGRLKFSPLHIIGPAMLGAAKEAGVPIAVHLDHGTTEACVKKALEIGFTSVMFDGSACTMEENIARTRHIIELARPYGAAVEAEIGKVGKNEDGTGSAEARCADPEDAVRFFEETGVDALAVAIGNKHGVYEGTPELHFDVLEKVRQKTLRPLVLHGGTGISEEDFRHCISLGMRKVNIATAGFNAVHKAAQGADNFFGMCGNMIDAAAEIAREHIRIFGTYTI